RALEGLKLTELSEDNWSLVEQSSGGGPEYLAAVAKIREALGSGLAGEAVIEAEALLRAHPHDESIEQLLAQARQALERSTLISAALEQAREALARGEKVAALAACRQVLEIDPAHREATLLLEQAEGSAEPAPASLELDLDLIEDTGAPPAPASASAPAAAPAAVELDLDLDAVPPPPATTQEVTVTPATPPAQAEPTTVRDLFDAAEDLEREISVEEFLPQTPAPQPVADEEPALVVQARQALTEGRLADAMELASRAMATSEEAPGAEEVLEQAREETQRRAGHAESLLVEGLAAMEAGNYDEAIPLFEQALELVPEHPEITEALDKARGLVSPPADGPPAEDLDFDALESIPLAGAAPAQPAAAATADEAAATGDFHAAAAEVPEAPPPPPPPPPLPESGNTGAAGAPPVALDAPEPLDASAASTGSPRGRVASSRGERSRTMLIGLLLVVLLAAGGWYGYGWWKGQQSLEAVPPTPPTTPVAASEPAATPAATAVPVEPTETDDATPPPPNEPQAPVYTARDVPRLLAEAERLLAAGKQAEAVKVLIVAQQADPTSFEVVERLQDARAALRERQQAEERIAIGRDAFEAGSYEEALRIFYRVPKAYQPEGLERWIANGWYNLGVRSLQAGDVVEAARFFADGLELVPGDVGAQRNRELARRYRRRGLDDAYRLYVSRLSLRGLDD
ncbi:MAG TPA: tetratricopeptide repeat protein, partial [Acidobacteria bacterium]|nr:tetratricopeptide repeat protein [Acidobacteriota bacterium]